MTATAPVSILTIDSGKLDHNSTITLTHGGLQAQSPNAVYRVEHSKSKPHLSVYRISSIAPQKQSAARSVLGEARPPYSHPAHILTPRPPQAQKLPPPSTKASQPPDIPPTTLLFPLPAPTTQDLQQQSYWDGVLSHVLFKDRVHPARH